MATTLALAVAVGPVSLSAQQRATRGDVVGRLTTCRVAGVDEDVRCASHRVFEDRASGQGRTIALNVVVLPATTDSVLPDPVVFLAGGGVVPATRYARFLATALSTVRRRRDIVLVDQRGTGGSGPLACNRATLDTATGLPPDERYVRYVAACRESLADRADVRFYTTPNAVDDLDDVREWLGYRTVNLYSASYGTSVAAAYVRRYPARVRRVVMHGVVPLDVSMQLDLARSAQQSLERVLDLCAADVTCKSAYPDLRGDLRRVLARFDSMAAANGPNQGANAGQPFRESLNTALSGVPSIRSVPMLVHDAARGAPPPQGPPPAGDPPPLGVRLAILCSEGIAHVDTTAISRATSGTFLGDFPVRFQMRWCAGWPTLPLPSDFRSPFRSDVPALLLTGDLDPITPPAYADRVAAWFANSRVLRLPNRSHSDTDPCVVGMIEAFIVAGGNGFDTSCLAQTPPIAFITGR